jgi:hypothetical protein
MRKKSKQRREQEQRLISLVEELYKETGGRWKLGQDAAHVIKLMSASLDAKGARKVAIQRQLDAIHTRFSA